MPQWWHAVAELSSCHSSEEGEATAGLAMPLAVAEAAGGDALGGDSVVPARVEGPAADAPALRRRAFSRSTSTCAREEDVGRICCCCCCDVEPLPAELPPPAPSQLAKPDAPVDARRTPVPELVPLFSALVPLLSSALLSGGCVGCAGKCNGGVGSVVPALSLANNAGELVPSARALGLAGWDAEAEEEEKDIGGRGPLDPPTLPPPMPSSEGAPKESKLAL